MKAFVNGTIFTGEKFEKNKAVIVENDKIIRVINVHELTSGLEEIDLKGGYLVPAFIDIQLYGGNGLLFSEYPSIASITATYDYSLKGGAAYILPTIATNSFEKIIEAIDAVREYWKMSLPGVIGLHIEGPFINPLKKGAHVEKFIRKPTLDDVKFLLEKGKGIVKIITLAPEVCPPEVIQYLIENDVIVSAGHTNANFEEAVSAFGKGINAATHLFNAMSPLQHRSPGMVGAVLNSSFVKASVVADGYHVDFPVIGIAKEVMKERLFLITDAVTENKNGIYPHHLDGEKYVVTGGILSGSALTMLKAVINCVEKIGIPLEEALRMASLYPAQVVKMDDSLGKIKNGYAAELLWLDQSLQAKGVYSRGVLTGF